MKRGDRIFIAGPYTTGDVASNVREAIEIADVLLSQDVIPFIPHLAHFWHLLCPHEYTVWTEYDIEWLKVCDGLLRMPGDSPGAENEIEKAKEFGIPVYYWNEFNWEFEEEHENDDEKC